MANPEHLAVLEEALREKDIGIWNRWRQEHPSVEPDLSGADCSGCSLNEIDLGLSTPSGINLQGANLIKADLSVTDLCESNLKQARFSFSNLREANLRGADLSGADLFNASLIEPHLT